jgi:hypothetical protein
MATNFQEGIYFMEFVDCECWSAFLPITFAFKCRLNGMHLPILNYNHNIP